MVTGVNQSLTDKSVDQCCHRYISIGIVYQYHPIPNILVPKETMQTKMLGMIYINYASIEVYCFCILLALRSWQRLFLKSNSCVCLSLPEETSCGEGANSSKRPLQLASAELSKLCRETELHPRERKTERRGKKQQHYF